MGLSFLKPVLSVDLNEPPKTAMIRETQRGSPAERWDSRYDQEIKRSGVLNQKKEWSHASAATWVGLEMLILNEVRKRKANTIWYHLCVTSKICHKWNYLWKRNRLIGIENRLVMAQRERRGMVGGERDREFRVSWCRLPIERIKNSSYCMAQETVLDTVINHDGKDEKNVDIRIIASLHCIAEINTTL